MSKGTTILSAALALAAACLLAAPASAQKDQPAKEKQAAPAEQPAGKGGACKADVEQFCKDVKPGKGGIFKCLKEHEAELSEPCKAQRGRMAARVKRGLNKAKQACQTDIDQFCKDVPEGEGRVAKCLKGHAEELSPSCKIAYDRVDIQVQKMKAARQAFEKFEEACKDDLDKLCKDVEAGKGRKLQCLKERQADLSDSCKAAMPKRAKSPKTGSKAPAKGEPKEEGGPQEQ